MKILQAIELISSNLLIIINKIEEIEKKSNLLNANDKSILLHIKEQSILRTTLILVLNDNLLKYEENFVKEEIQKSHEFCKKAKKRLQIIEKQFIK